jgi:hypothetical protein
MLPKSQEGIFEVVSLVVQLVALNSVTLRFTGGITWLLLPP